MNNDFIVLSSRRGLALAVGFGIAKFEQGAGGGLFKLSQKMQHTVILRICKRYFS